MAPRKPSAATKAAPRRGTATTATKRAPLTRLIARFITGLSYDKIPRRILIPMQQSVPDTIGCALLGASTDFAQLVGKFLCLLPHVAHRAIGFLQRTDQAFAVAID